MNIFEKIQEKEEEDFGKCTKCRYFLSYGDGKCDIYEYPDYGISNCPDFELSEFWATKRGY